MSVNPLQTTIESMNWELFSTVKGLKFVNLKHEKHAEKHEEMTRLQGKNHLKQKQTCKFEFLAVASGFGARRAPF